MAQSLHPMLDIAVKAARAAGAIINRAALDLCYVAAGWYDGFFETGLSPWDVAAGSLIVTEAGGLVGNFTDEADFLHQREVVAGNPRLYGQLVQLLAPFSRALGPAGKAPEAAAAPDATAAFLAAATDGNAPDTEPGPDTPRPGAAPGTAGSPGRRNTARGLQPHPGAPRCGPQHVGLVDTCPPPQTRGSEDKCLSSIVFFCQARNVPATFHATSGNQLKGEVLMKLFVRALGIAALTAAAASASAAPMFYNTTHVDNAYLNWQVSTNTPPGGDGNFADFLTAGPWTTAAACTNVPLTHGATSPVRLDWIANIPSCSNSTNGGIGGDQWTQFIFRQSFTLTAAEAASLQLTFNWAADDSGQVHATRGSWTPKWSLNSLAFADLKPTIWPGSPAPGNTYGLSPTVAVSGFQAGVNTMYFWVQGNGITDGMSLMNAQFSNKVPEPASLALVGLALLGAGVARRRSAARG